MSYKNSKNYRDLAAFIRDDSEFKVEFFDKFPEAAGYEQKDFESTIDEFIRDIYDNFKIESITLDKRYLDISYFDTGSVIFDIDTIFDEWKCFIEELKPSDINNPE